MKLLLSVPDGEATSHHRVLNPINELVRLGLAEFQILNQNELNHQLKWADLILLQCLLGPQQVELIKKIKSTGKPLIIDYDDDFSALPPHVLDRFKITQSEAEINWRYYLQSADYLTTSCEYLKERMLLSSERPEQDIKILLNCLLPREYDPAREYSPRENGNEVRILYSCADSHLADFKWISPVLSWLGNHYPNVSIETQGTLKFGFHNPTYKGKTRHHSFAPYLVYHESLRNISPHITIGPLLPNTHAKSRSNIKYLQSASVKSAFVASAEPPYSCIQHGKTGFLAKNRLQWWWYLRKLIRNPNLRKQMAENAFEDAESYLIGNHIEKWNQFYRTAIEEKKKKNAVV